MPKVYNAPPGFELNPAGMAKELQELRRWKSTHAPRLEALEGLLHAAQHEAHAGREAIATLASERAANALLTDEIDRLREECARLLVDAENIAAIAHDGGLEGVDAFDALCHVRRLTLRYWNKSRTTAEAREAVRAASLGVRK